MALTETDLERGTIEFGERLNLTRMRGLLMYIAEYVPNNGLRFGTRGDTNLKKGLLKEEWVLTEHAFTFESFQIDNREWGSNGFQPRIDLEILTGSDMNNPEVPRFYTGMRIKRIEIEERTVQSSLDYIDKVRKATDSYLSEKILPISSDTKTSL